jgi:hypothetical protein
MQPLEQRKLLAAQAWAEEAEKGRNVPYKHIDEKRRIWD